MAGYRPSFSLDEDNEILRLIVGSKLYYDLRCKGLWLDMSKVTSLHRTWQSLFNRFRRYIIYNITNPIYKISEVEKCLILIAWKQTGQKQVCDCDCDNNSEEYFSE